MVLLYCMSFLIFLVQFSHKQKLFTQSVNLLIMQDTLMLFSCYWKIRRLLASVVYLGLQLRIIRHLLLNSCQFMLSVKNFSLSFVKFLVISRDNTNNEKNKKIMSSTSVRKTFNFTFCNMSALEVNSWCSLFKSSIPF